MDEISTVPCSCFAAIADKAIAGDPLTRDECAEVLAAPDSGVPGLLAEDLAGAPPLLWRQRCTCMSL